MLIADKFEQSGQDGLEAAGCEFSYQPDVKDEALVEAIRSYAPDVLVVRSTKVTEPMIEAGALKLIVRAGAGYNTIDVAAASRRGVYVSNCPGKNSVAVAELAMALILALDRRVADNVIQLREGKWNKKEFSRARGLLGRTLGLIGTGQIGREVVTRARAFGMRVVAWSRSLTDETATVLGVERLESLLDVARESDVVSVHVALKPETRGLIGADFFGAMRDGAYFVNTSRGEVVDQVALLRAMREKRLRAGLDVFAQEPSGGTGEFTDEIAREPNLYGTHHIGASTDQAQEAIAAETVRVIRTFKETGRVPNVVNLARRSPATHTLVVRHRDRPGVLASVLDRIRAESINVQEMENVIFEGSEAAVARINLEGALDAGALQRLKADNEDIIELSLIEIRNP
ncbi:MAG TPA: 3-phosphoglycerate dehydrogenase family protein [Pyrinomonadaceae bacterium]|nr:3-phosphoglycerate dehydrogenase family protein [Pyrinomonadaceae bacterium]